MVSILLSGVKLGLSLQISLLLLLCCKQSNAVSLDTPSIVAGKVKLTGIVTSPNSENRDSISVTITVPHQITGEFVKYKTVVDRSGNFSIEGDVETSESPIVFSTSLNPNIYLLLRVKSGEANHINVSYDSRFQIENIQAMPGVIQKDMTRYFDVFRKMMEYPPSSKPEPLYNKSPDYYLNYIKNLLAERLSVVENDELISSSMKQIVSRDFTFIIYKQNLLGYESQMRGDYRRFNGGTEKPNIQTVDKSFFHFLKDLKLNDPQFLHAGSFWEFQRELLRNEVLEIPQIDDIDIPTWLSRAKSILSDLVGFNNGIYYDILAANAYGRQLTEEQRPLSEKQKRNIFDYWGNGEFAKILLRKNEEVVRLDKFKSPAVINDVSKIPADKLIDNIVSKYKGKVVLIDLWATWCGPCLEAMTRFKNAKTEFYDQDVAFVYLTNVSSPPKLWQEKIKGIGNEHYYLTTSQWTYIMEHFGFDAIPSYILYDKQGVLANKFTALPENDEVKKMINDLLK